MLTRGRYAQVHFAIDELLLLPCVSIAYSQGRSVEDGDYCAL